MDDVRRQAMDLERSHYLMSPLLYGILGALRRTRGEEHPPARYLMAVERGLSAADVENGKRL